MTPINGESLYGGALHRHCDARGLAERGMQHPGVSAARRCATIMHVDALPLPMPVLGEGAQPHVGWRPARAHRL